MTRPPISANRASLPTWISCWPPRVEQRRSRSLVAEERRGAGHVGADRDGPDRELVPGQQVAGEGEQQREHQQDDADVPVELPRRLVGAGHEDAEHVQPDRDHHGVRAPAVELAHDAERGRLAQVHDVDVGVLDRGPVVEHQQQPGDGLDQEQEERRASHAPGVAHPDARLLDLHRVQVEDHVAEHRQRALAVVGGDADPEDRLPHLRLGGSLLQLVEHSHVRRFPSAIRQKRRTPDRPTVRLRTGTCGLCR